MEGEDWPNFFRPSFSKAVDGVLWDLKLGIDEIVAVAILTGDCMHHCANLVLEESLQEHNLNDLGEQGIFPSLLLFLFIFLWLVILLTLMFLNIFMQQSAL